MMKLGNDGNEMPDEENDRKLGADTPQNASGGSSVVLSSLRLVRADKGPLHRCNESFQCMILLPL